MKGSKRFDKPLEIGKKIGLVAFSFVFVVIALSRHTEYISRVQFRGILVISLWLVILIHLAYAGALTIWARRFFKQLGAWIDVH